MTTNQTNIPDLYAKALDSTRRYVEGVGRGQWHVSTPCSEWDLTQLLRHVVYGMVWVPDMLDGKTIDEVGDRYEGDLLGADSLAAYDAASAIAKAASQVPGTLDATCHTSRGDASGTGYITGMLNDVFIHGWDIAKATGQDTELDRGLVEFAYEAYAPRRGSLAGRAFAEEPPVAEGASLQARLLAIVGRTA